MPVTYKDDCNSTSDGEYNDCVVKVSSQCDALPITSNKDMAEVEADVNEV